MGTLQPELPIVEVSSRSQWRAWLAAHCDQPTGVWAVTWKKAAVPAGEARVTARDLNEECLCFGWIDSKPGRVDAERTALLCTPRKAGSGWSKLNKDRVDALLAAGLVAAPGLKAIATAKADGSWFKLDEVDALREPGDLVDALSSVVGARANWDAFPPSARRGILEWITQAKRPATRTARIEQTARLAGENIRANQWPRR